MAITNTINPVLVQLGPLSIRWYGLFFALGVLLVYLYCRKQAKNGRLQISADDFDEIFFWLVIGMIAGARLFEILFYNHNTISRYSKF